MTLAVVTFLWDKPGYRSKFLPAHVRTMQRMVGRHYQRPHTFHCVTDKVTRPCRVGAIQLHPLWTKHANVPNPHGPANPSCYRRLKLYSDAARKQFGERILSIDLDMVLVDDVSPLWDRPEPFGFWIDQLNRHGFVNGAMQLITPGRRDDIWTGFDPANTPAIAKRAGCWGSDQGVLSYHFKSDKAPPYATWGTAEGAFSWRVHCQPHGGLLPSGARVVNFHGQQGDPWELTERVPWIKEHYR